LPDLTIASSPTQTYQGASPYSRPSEVYLILKGGFRKTSKHARHIYL
jgi:hypothetical protein